jgi:hypothetical protein
MITTNADFVSVELRTNQLEMVHISKPKVAKKENLIVFGNAIIPIINKAAIHFLDSFKRPTCILNDIGMRKMST